MGQGPWVLWAGGGLPPELRARKPEVPTLGEGLGAAISATGKARAEERAGALPCLSCTLQRDREIVFAKGCVVRPAQRCLMRWD